MRLLIPLLLLASVAIAAPVPDLLSYQGRISDASGALVGAGAPVNKLIKFALFDAETGGTAVWVEQQYANIADGEFTALLGNGSAVGANPHPTLSSVFAANSGLWLEITVDGAAIAPRQRMTTTGYAFRVTSADSISTGSSLGFLPSSDVTSVDYGLGLYDTGRQFNNVTVNGPVLYGQGGGALGSSASGTQNIALNWLADGKVGIGVVPPTERLDVDGNIKSTGTLALGGALSVTDSVTANGVSGTSYTSAGLLSTTGSLTGTSLSIRATPGGTEVAGFSSSGAINVTRGGQLLGPLGNVLNIETVGTITTVDLEVTGTLSLPPGVTTGVTQVLSATKRLVLGGATGWGSALADTPAVPLSGSNAATGMRLIFSGTDASSDLIGLGMSDANSFFSIAPSAGVTRWFGGTQELMSLNNNDGHLRSRQLTVAHSAAKLDIKASTGGYSLLALEGGGADSLGLVSWAGGGAELYFDNVTSRVPMMSFKRTSTDEQLADQVPDLGYVGIGTDNPKAPLHVKAGTSTYTGNVLPNSVYFPPSGGLGSTTQAQRQQNGIFLGSNGGAMYNDGQAVYAPPDNSTVTYQHIAGLFEGELVARRMWFGDAIDTSSDARAKHILGRSNAAHDLATLLKLEVTDYHWIDRTVDSHRPHKRLIAQQVQSTFPQASGVSPLPQAIPSVYEAATDLRHDEKTETLTITTRKAHGFAAGDLVDLFTEKTALKETKVASVVDEHRFVIACAEPPQSLFVYGKQVKDFRTVDYDAISMLNVSATQALKKEHDDLAAANAALRAELAAQAKTLAQREANQRALNDELIAIEAALHQRTQPQPAVKTAALK